MNNTSIFIHPSIGNIGIGTTNPSEKFNVVGNISASGNISSLNQLIGPVGSVSVPSFTFTGDTTTGMFNSGSSILAFTSAGAEKMRITSSGLSVGTTNTGYDLRVGDKVYFETPKLEFLYAGSYASIRIGAGSSTTDTRLYLYNGQGVNNTNLIVYSMSKTVGSFDIDHPTLPTKRLVHSFVEGPRCDNIYRGDVQLINGMAIINLDKDCTHLPECAMTEGTFVVLNRNPTVYLQNKTTFDRLRYEISGNQLTIICENTTSTATVNWMVVAERKDKDMLNWNKTTPDGYLITEYDKEV